MRLNMLMKFAGLSVALAVAGCASDPGSSLMTASVQRPETKKVSRPAINPACVTLATQIRAIREDGTPERVRAAGEGKTKMVSVKRASLSKVAELDRLNAEFQAQCSIYPLQTAAAPPAAPTATIQTAPVSTPPASVTAAPKATVSTKPVAASKPTVQSTLVAVPPQTTATKQ